MLAIKIFHVAKLDDGVRTKFKQNLSEKNYYNVGLESQTHTQCIKNNNNVCSQVKMCRFVQEHLLKTSKSIRQFYGNATDEESKVKE